MFALCITGCETVDALLQNIAKPTASLESLSLSNLSLSDATVDIAVKVNNPYSVAIPNVSLDYALKTQAIDFVAGKITSDKAIPAGGSSTIHIPVSVTYASLLNLAQTVRPGQVVAYDANVKFSTNVPGIGSVSLPLSKKGELPVPTIPKVSIGSVDWGNISLTNTTATINLNVTNLNDFAVTMKKLNYDFAIGGQSVLNSQVTKALKFENGQQQTIQIPVSFKATSLGLGVLNMIKNKKASYTMTGRLDADTPFGALTLPFLSE
jgi:LEA14-like dessication related protein